MNRNITQVIRAIRILDESIPARDSAGKLEIYTAVKMLLREIEENLHPTYGHHVYTRENIMRVDDVIAAKCGFAQLADTSGANWSVISARLDSSLILLSGPERWPSTCTLVDDHGNERNGTNDPS